MVYEVSSGDLGLLFYANYIYLIVVPETKDGLNPAIGEAHRRYTRRINFREGWRGHLWQGSFLSLYNGRELSAGMYEI